MLAVRRNFLDEDGAMRVEGWIFEGNLPPFVKLVASSLGYAWDDGDQAAVDHGMTDTDVEADHWFEYPIVPAPDDGPEAVVAVAYDVGGSVVFIRVDVNDPGEHLVGHIEALLDVCASCSVSWNGNRRAVHGA